MIKEVVKIDKEIGLDILTSDLDEILKNADSIIHLAGVLGTEELFDMPEKAIAVNVQGSLKVLQGCRKNNVGYVGITMPQVWTNVYQATKRCSQELATAWHNNFGVPVSHVRAFNAFGPNQKHYGVQKIVPTFAIRAWRGESLPIWGDGSQTVDLVHADDVAKMLVNATEFKSDEVLDAGTGHAITVKEVAEFIIESTGSSSDIEYLPMRKGETKTDIVAKGEGWGDLNWSPKYDPEQLRDTVNWYKDIALSA